MVHAEETDYLKANYGNCDRGTDCYWGTNAAGQFDGCLKAGWRGCECNHWHPVAANSWAELADEMKRRRNENT